MSTQVNDFLKGLPEQLHKNFLKLVEYNFWKFQYACRHFQMHYKQSLDIDFADTEIRNYPYFNKTLKILKKTMENLKEEGEPEDVISSVIDKSLYEFRKTDPGLPDEVIQAIKDILFHGKWPPRKKIKNKSFTKNRIDLVVPILKDLATKSCGVSPIDFETMINGQLTSDEWEQNESIQRFCYNLRERTDKATIRHDLEMSLFDIETPYQEQQRIVQELDTDKRNFGDEYISINDLLFHVSTDFGNGYYVCDLFRGTDFGKLPSFFETETKYYDKLKSDLCNGVFWQPIIYKSAIEWIFDYILRFDRLEPYIAINSDSFEQFSAFEYFDSLMLDNAKGGTITVFVNSFSNTDSVADLKVKISKIKNAIELKIHGLKRLNAHRQKSEEEKEDSIIYSDNVFKVVLNSNVKDMALVKWKFFLTFDFNHKDFKLKRVIDRLCFVYIVHTDTWDLDKYIDLISDTTPIVKDFKHGTMTRPIGLWIWDNVHTGMKKLPVVLKEAENFITLKNPKAPYSVAYLQEIYEITKKCIAEKKVLPIS